MSSALSLPANWIVDRSLRHVLPPTCDFRTFKRARINPDRYAVCVVGTGVFDILRGVFCKNRPTKKTSVRQRYGIVPSGPNALEVLTFYSRLICEAAYGSAPGPDYEAHHQGDDPSVHHFHDLVWQTKRQNRKLATRSRKRRTGENNGRHKMTDRDLQDFLRWCDEDRSAKRAHDLEFYSHIFDVSPRQLQRILAGSSRAADVKRIRDAIRAESHALLLQSRKPGNFVSEKRHQT